MVNLQPKQRINFIFIGFTAELQWARNILFNLFASTNDFSKSNGPKHMRLFIDVWNAQHRQEKRVDVGLLENIWTIANLLLSPNKSSKQYETPNVDRLISPFSFRCQEQRSHRMIDNHISNFWSRQRETCMGRHIAGICKRPCGLMDKALVFGTKDCRFESCQGHS